MSLSAKFDGQRVLFSPLEELYWKQNLAIKYVKDGGGIPVLNRQTQEVVNIKLDENSLRFRLHMPLGDDWHSKVAQIVDVFSHFHSQLEKILANSKEMKDRYPKLSFIPLTKIAQVAGAIAQTILFSNEPHSHVKRKDSGAPVGFHLFRANDPKECSVFMNLKGSPPLGEDGDHKFKLCVELNSRKWCCKEIVKGDSEEAQKVVKILTKLKGTRGIIPIYFMSESQEKHPVFFQELFEADLCKLECDRPITLEERIQIMKDLLSGLIYISKYGTFINLHEKNILVSGRDDEMRAVFTCFGYFRSHGEKCGDSYVPYYPPGFNGTPSPPFDVWKLGLVFYSLVMTRDWPQFPEYDEGISVLKSKWVEMRKEVPISLQNLIHGMTEPDSEKRWSAAEAFLFLEEAYPSKIPSPVPGEEKTE